MLLFQEIFPEYRTTLEVQEEELDVVGTISVNFAIQPVVYLAIDEKTVIEIEMVLRHILRSVMRTPASTLHQRKVPMLIEDQLDFLD